MLALISVFAVVLLSLLITRVATVALTMTGLSREAARFQARSALSGTGFTTNEAESVVNHPVRRRIILTLMLVGSAGLVTAIASLIVSFGGISTEQRAIRGLLLVGGLFVLWMIARSKWFDRYLSSLIARLLREQGIESRDYATLLALAGEYEVAELRVRPGDWIANRTLRELRLHDEGIVVLGIHRTDGSYLGIPKGDTLILAEDTLMLYGREEQVMELDHRNRGRSGDLAHVEATEEQHQVEEEQIQRDVLATAEHEIVRVDDDGDVHGGRPLDEAETTGSGRSQSD
ncbi:MAG: TrkA C-terminal domain-containing protein [Solirubrobacterales bacterium]